MIATDITFWLQLHGRRRTVHPAICQCGQWYYARKYLVSKGQGTTCSRSCRGRFTDCGKKFKPGSDHPKYKGATYTESVTNGGTKSLEKWARAQLWSAVERGDIVRPDVCSMYGCDHAGKIEGHHTDYEKPLDVQWLCLCCHRGEHGIQTMCREKPETARKQ